MGLVIEDPNSGEGMRVSEDGRGHTFAVTRRIESERADEGYLFGVGTGFLTIPAALSADSPILWWDNNNTQQLHAYVVRLIFGWNGGDSNGAPSVRSMINYGGSRPTGANTADTNVANDNQASPITASAVGLRTDSWDGTGTAGMTGITGESPAIPNQPGTGNTSLDLHENIVLGVGDSQQFNWTRNFSEAAVANCAVVLIFKRPGSHRLQPWTSF